MKRDARIGLAVVLVLGLMVTLLVGRAIYNSNDQSAEMDGTLPALEGAAPHSDAVQTPAAANSDINLNSAAPAPAGDALNRFVDDQTRNLGPTSAAPAPAPMPAPVPSGRAPMIEEPVVALNPQPQPIGGDRTPAPQPQPQPRPIPLNPDLLDHESHMVSNTPTENAAPADGFGYTVQAGDNIWKISAKVYGDGKFSQKIADANKDVNAQKLKVGTVLKIPTLPNKTVLAKLPSYAEAKAGKTTPAAIPHDSGPVSASRGVQAPIDRFGIASNDTAPAAVTGPEQKHTVAAGESLSAIAQKYYGASGPKSVGRILAANKGLDASKLKIGQELTIPAK